VISNYYENGSKGEEQHSINIIIYLGKTHTEEKMSPVHESLKEFLSILDFPWNTDYCIEMVMVSLAEREASRTALKTVLLVKCNFPIIDKQGRDEGKGLLQVVLSLWFDFNK
jgi:hypothetical protein